MDLSTGMRLYAVSVTAYRPDGTARTMTTTITAVRAQQAEAEVLAESRRQMPPPFSRHAVVGFLDISNDARAFVATYGA